MRIVLACLVAGCGVTEEPIDEAPAPDGTYHVHSQIDLTVEVLLPEPAEVAVVTLRDFSTNPAHALIDLADQAGVPAVQEIRDALPDFLLSELEGWINDEIAKLALDGVPVTELAGDVAGAAQTALTRFTVDSTLAIEGGDTTHTLTALDLGHGMRVALGSALAVARPACSTRADTLAIGDHAYGLAYGEYLWTALNERMVTMVGFDVRGALGAAVNCPALAQAVAAKCAWSYCVGHAVQLEEICERGLDQVVELAHTRIAEERFDALHFAAGSATIVDSGLAKGVWMAEINAGLGLRPVPATFTGSR